MAWIKFCGTTNLEDARAAAAVGADAVGFLFAPSPRRIDPEAARAIIAQLPPGLEKVGVFVNQTVEHLREVAVYAGLTAMQLHGDESPEFARNLRQSAPGLRIFKAVAVAPGVEGVLRRFAGSAAVDAVLLDSAPRPGDPSRGGTGRSFDWSRAVVFVPGLTQRVILAGGLSPENVGVALRKLRPWGVDVCTGVESEPGRKDHDKLRAFVAAVRTAGERT
jgi:phosphoribosylanthranilate isomerase